MTEHRAQIAILRPAERVFPLPCRSDEPAALAAFVARGVPRHLRFAVEHDALRLSRGAATDLGVAGNMPMEARPGGVTVSLALRLGIRAARREAMAHWTGDAALDLAGAIRASLEAVKRHCEGVTQGVEPVSGGTQSCASRAKLRDSRGFGGSATQNLTTS